MIQIDYIQSSRLHDILVPLRSFHQDLNLLEIHTVFIFVDVKFITVKLVRLIRRNFHQHQHLTLHIRRAYLQAYLWYYCALTESVDIKPEDFGYLQNENKQLIPHFTNNCSIPESFPKPCSCLKCTQQKVCGCRKMSVICCKYSKCGSGDDCQNLIDK